MHQIDEHTYIGKSLVTCAEYQSFIDEMRAQGALFQPDHWTTYKFPDGQAQAPILGIRLSDARAFCEWQTQRDTNGWYYRLPTPDEALAQPLAPVDLSPLGYWTLGKNNEAQFTWAGPTPANPRALNHERAYALDLAIDIDHDLAYALDLDRACAHAHDIARVGTRVQARDIDLVFTLDRVRDLVLALDHIRDLTTTNRLHNLALALDRVRAYTYALDIDHAGDFVLDIYIDLFTLEERIAGRSPAFEGLRLVKERR